MGLENYMNMEFLLFSNEVRKMLLIEDELDDKI